MKKKPDYENIKEPTATMADFKKKFARYTQSMREWAKKVQEQRDRKSGKSN